MKSGFQPERAPPFLQHFAHRWARGAKPFSGTRSDSICFIRHRDPSPLTESHVVALVDCIPTPAISMLTAPAPASSLVWNLEFFEHEFGFGPDRWWRIDTEHGCGDRRLCESDRTCCRIRTGVRLRCRARCSLFSVDSPAAGDASLEVSRHEGPIHEEPS